MNFSKIISNIAEADSDAYERLSPRRRVLKNWLRGAALTAIPFAVGSVFNKAQAKSTDVVSDSLNYLLTLEYLESEFYKLALEASVGPGPAAHDPLIPSGLEQSAIITIAGHERGHVDSLKQVIAALGSGSPVKAPTFDFTANGAFPTVFEDYDVFLAVAQTIEDTVVRAIKGVLPNLIGHSSLLQVIRVHSTDARHAAHIRAMRRDTPGPLNSGNIKPWVTGASGNISDPTYQPSYDGEDNTQQNGIQIVNINGLLVDSIAASQSFDEPLPMATVQAIISQFIVP